MSSADCRPDPFSLLGPYHDAHMHLDFALNGEDLACAAAAEGLSVFANTVTLDGFERAQERFAAFGNVHVGVGLHPWWADETFDANRFELLAARTRFVGEVGLDFGPKHAGNREAQTDAFECIAGICARQGGKLLSIHAVKSANAVLDVLEAAGVLDSCTCIFHWFSDSGDALVRAREDGCYFSINPMMLAMRRGREYARQLPRDRMLVETDAPPGEGVVYGFEDWKSALGDVGAVLDEIR